MVRGMVDKEQFIAGIKRILHKDHKVLDIVRLLPAVIELNLINLHITQDKSDMSDEQMISELRKYKEKLSNTSLVEKLISTTLAATMDDTIPGSDIIMDYIRGIDMSKDEIIESLAIGLLSFLQIILSGDISFYEETLEHLKEEIPDDDYVNVCLKVSEKYREGTPLH